jgi:hypothetical protein
MARTIELYDMLKDKLGEKESKLLIETIENITEKVKAEAATKADLELEVAKIKEDLTRLEMRLIKWVLGTGVGVVAFLYALLKGIKF